MKKIMIAVISLILAVGTIAAPICMAHSGAMCRRAPYCAEECTNYDAQDCYGTGHHRRVGRGMHHRGYNCDYHDYCINR